MGNLIWRQWARLLALTAATSSLWAFIYRKFFWDFVGGTLGPVGIIPDATGRAFDRFIKDIPVLQTITLAMSAGALALEYPLPLIKGTMLHRSHTFRIILYLFAAVFGALVYQTFDCALYFVITAAAYGRSMALKETIGDEKRTRSAA